MSNSKINKILFDISFPEGDKNDALKKAKDLFYSKAMKIIEQELEHYDGAVSISKLELDLGLLTEDELEDSLRVAIKKQLHKAPQSGTIIKQRLSFNSKQHTTEDRENILSDTDYLLYFLQRGYWPWHMQNEPENTIQNFLFNYLKDEERTAVLFQLLSHQTKNVLRRFLTLIFSSQKLKTLFQSALRALHPLFDTFTSLLNPAYEQNILAEHNFAYQLFYELLKTTGLQSLNDIKQLVYQTFRTGFYHKGKSIAFTDEKEKEFQHQIATCKDIQSVKLLIENVFKEQINGKENTSLSSQKNDHVSKTDTSEKHKAIPENSHNKDFEVIIIEEDEKITISNAGLILFHLYLPYIFRDLKWTDASNKFTDAAKQQKAVHFLQYLIDGKSRHEEHLLVLNKILCGWPIHLPLTLKCNFSKKEKQIATDAIDSLKEHWTALKNTSARGLMESFVQRKGIVQRNKSGYLLQIERKTIDILLDSLPFGIGTIKLPWNEYIISTEW